MPNNFAIAYLQSNTIPITFFETKSELACAVQHATRSQIPFTTFAAKRRNNHNKPVWHPTQTQFFDPKS